MNNIFDLLSSDVPIRILVVDDTDYLRTSLLESFQTIHPEWLLTPASSPEEAIRLIDGNEGYDVIITDMRMPRNSDDDEIEGEQGLRVVSYAREKDPLCEIIVITAYESFKNVYNALKAGANQYIPRSMEGASELRLVATENAVARSKLRRDLELIKSSVTARQATQLIENESFVHHFLTNTTSVHDVHVELENDREALVELSRQISSMQKRNSESLSRVQTIISFLDGFSSNPSTND